MYRFTRLFIFVRDVLCIAIVVHRAEYLYDGRIPYRTCLARNHDHNDAYTCHGDKPGSGYEQPKRLQNWPSRDVSRYDCKPLAEGTSTQVPVD
jgi:hypothetical protein